MSARGAVGLHRTGARAADRSGVRVETDLVIASVELEHRATHTGASAYTDNQVP